jgi:hypothetical protein
VSLTQIKDEAAHLPVKEQRELIVFLVAWQTEQDHGFQHKLASKIDDHDPAHWMDLEDVRKRYAAE